MTQEKERNSMHILEPNKVGKSELHYIKEMMNLRSNRSKDVRDIREIKS